MLNVDDAAREGLNQEVRHQGQKASQHDEPDVVLLQQGHHHLLVVQFRFGGYGRGHAQTLGTLQRQGVGFVADHEGTVDTLRIFEVAYQILTVRAASRHKDGNVYHIC